MKVISFDGITLASLGGKGLVTSQSAAPEVDPFYDASVGRVPAFVGGMPQPTELQLTLQNADGGTLDRGAVLAVMRVGTGQAVDMVVQAMSGSQQYTVAGVVNRWRAQPGGIIAHMTVGELLWREVAAESVSDTQPWGDPGISLPFTNAGHAPANLIITFAGTDLNTPAITSKLARRRTFTITNASAETWQKLAVKVPLGATTSWVGGSQGALADASNVYLFDASGIERRREFVNFGTAVSYLWMVVENLGPGQSREYRICYAVPLATAPLDFSTGATSADVVAAKRAAPVFDTGWTSSFSSSVTSTTLTKTGAGWATDEWAGGTLEYLNGPAAGQQREVIGNNGTVATVGTAFSPAPTSGNTYLISMSDTDRYVYDVRQVERSDFKRGLWWINRGQNRPSRRSHDGPGAWRPVLTLDNNDDKVAKVWTPITIVVTADYFAIPDINYSWDGAGPFGGEFEVANAYQFDSPLPITAWTVGWQSKNPNGVAKLRLGMKEDGATDWETIPDGSGGFLEITTHSDTLVNTAALEYSTVPVEGVTKHLLFEALPWNDTEIPLDWIKDTGTSTSGSTTQLNDNTKEWQSDQFNNGTIYLRSGIGSPSSRAVTDSSPNTITVGSAFPADVNDDTKFEVRNKKLVATFRSNDKWWVDFDTSDVVLDTSDLTSFDPNYDLDLTIRLDGGAGGADAHQRARVGLDGQRVMHIGLDPGTVQALRIDGVRRAVEIIDVASGDVVETLAEPFVKVQTVTANGKVRKAGDWFPASPGAHTLYLEWEGGDADIGGDLTISFVQGVYGG